MDGGGARSCLVAGCETKPTDVLDRPVVPWAGQTKALKLVTLVAIFFGRDFLADFRRRRGGTVAGTCLDGWMVLWATRREPDLSRRWPEAVCNDPTQSVT